MSDKRLRELERRYQETGSPEDEAEFHQERRRLGEHVATLDGLDEVPWAELQHAYGSAADVPGLLRQLRSRDAEVLEKTRWQLYGNIFHQGTRYQATPHAVPFIFDLLRDRFTPGRAWLVHYLVSLALGYQEEHLPFGGAVERWRGWLTEITEAEERSFVEAVVRTYEAVEAGVEHLIACTTEADAELREAAAFALAWFPSRAELSRPALHALLDEGDPLRLYALIGLGLLGDARDASRLRAFLVDPDPWVRRCAALGSALILRESTPADAVELLIEGVGADRDEQPELAFQDGDLAGLMGSVLAALGGDAQERALPAMVASLRAATGMDALNLAGSILALVFQQPAPARASELDEAQRQVLTALAETPQAWELGGHTLGNFSLMMMEFGLPGSCEELGAYLQTS